MWDLFTSNTVHFRDEAKKYPITKSGFYTVPGKVVENLECPRLKSRQ